MEGLRHSTQQNYSEEMSQLSSFNAVRNLKKAQSEYELIRNRIKVLQVNDEKNSRKINNNLSTINKIEIVRNFARTEQTKLKQNKLSKQKDLQSKKRRNQNIKEQINIKNRQKKQSVQNKKSETYQYMSSVSKSNHKKIQSFKLETAEERRLKHNVVLHREEQSKENVNNYLIKKNKTIHEDQNKENDFLQKKRERKLEQIQNLQKVEMQLVKRFSQSHHAFQSVKNKLDTMLGKIKNQKSEGRRKMVEKQKPLQRSESFYVINKNRIN